MCTSGSFPCHAAWEEKRCLVLACVSSIPLRDVVVECEAGGEESQGERKSWKRERKDRAADSLSLPRRAERFGEITEL